MIKAIIIEGHCLDNFFDIEIPGMNGFELRRCTQIFSEYEREYKKRGQPKSMIYD